VDTGLVSAAASPTKTRLVYLLAASHSGSTLLTMLLGAHREMCTAGELKAVSLGDVARYRCSCGALIRECVFWRAVTAAMEAQGYPFDVADAGTDIRTGATPYVRRLLRPLHRGAGWERLRDLALSLSPAWRRQLPRIQRRNAVLAATVCRVRGRSVIVDSSKIGLRLKYLLRTPGIDIKVIRMIRDGRAVALTYMDPAGFADTRNPALRGGGMGGDRADERLTMQAAAREWRRSYEEGTEVLKGLEPSRWTEARYEELCADPEKTLRRLFSFVGVDPDGGTLDFRSREHHVIGNGMRLDDTREIQLDERWRTTLGPSELADFEAVAGDLNRRLGYH
jgi:hypothetical protein